MTRKSGRPGLKRTEREPEERLAELLTRAWRTTVRVKGDYARTNAEIVGMAASLQMITTKIAGNKFASAWHITNKGLTWLNEMETE